jgi:hypothetical protein
MCSEMICCFRKISPYSKVGNESFNVQNEATIQLFLIIYKQYLFELQSQYFQEKKFDGSLKMIELHSFHSACGKIPYGSLDECMSFSYRFLLATDECAGSVSMDHVCYKMVTSHLIL